MWEGAILHDDHLTLDARLKAGNRVSWGLEAPSYISYC